MNIPWCNLGCECWCVPPQSFNQISNVHQYHSVPNNMDQWSYPRDYEQMPYPTDPYRPPNPNMSHIPPQQYAPPMGMDGGQNYWNSQNYYQPPQPLYSPSQQNHMPKYVRRQCSCLVPLTNDENILDSGSESDGWEAEEERKHRRGRNGNRRSRKSRRRPKSISSMICYPMCQPCTACISDYSPCCPMCPPCNPCMQCCCMIPSDIKMEGKRRSSKYKRRDCVSSSSSATSSTFSSYCSSTNGKYRNQSCNKTNSITRIAPNISCSCLSPIPKNTREHQRNEKCIKRPKRTKCDIGDNGWIIDPLMKRQIDVQKHVDKDNRLPKHKQPVKYCCKCK